MGLSSSKTTTVNKPSEQSVQAGNTLNSVFQTQLPRIQGYADQIGGLMPSMIDRFNQGDPGVNAAQGYITRTLQDGGSNPFLQQMIDMAGNDTGNQLNAKLGVRGNIGGSVQARILASELGKQNLGLRYNDWQAAQQRQAQAAGMAPGVAAANTIQIAPLLAAAQYAGGAPLNATSQYASGMGGLFGNTGTSTSTQSSPWGMTLLNALASGARAAAGGG